MDAEVDLGTTQVVFGLAARLNVSLPSSSATQHGPSWTPRKRCVPYSHARAATSTSRSTWFERAPGGDQRRAPPRRRRPRPSCAPWLRCGNPRAWGVRSPAGSDPSTTGRLWVSTEAEGTVPERGETHPLIKKETEVEFGVYLRRTPGRTSRLIRLLASATSPSAPKRSASMPFGSANISWSRGIMAPPGCPRCSV